MSGKLMSNEYRSAAARSGEIVKSLESRIREIRREGRTPEWTQRQIVEATDAARSALRAQSVEMKVEAVQVAAEAEQAFEHSRRPVTQNKNAAAEAVYLQRINMAMEGMDPEDVPEFVKNYRPHPDDAGFEYLLEEAAKARVRGTDYEWGLNEAIESRMTAEQRVHLAAAEVAERMLAHDKTLRGFLVEDLNRVAVGEDRFTKDPVGLLETLEDRARHPYTGPTPQDSQSR